MRGFIRNVEAVTPSGEAREREAREAHRRAQLLRVAMRSSWPELARKDLQFSRHWIEHVPTGHKYRVFRGEVAASYTPISAYYFDESGGVVFLEPA